MTTATQPLPSSTATARMDTLANLGRVAIGLALVAFGIANFIVRDFVAGRAPAWPTGMPGQTAWAYLSGALLVAAGVIIVTRRDRRATQAALLAAAIIAVWALLRHLPLVAADRVLGGAWTNFGKALALSGGIVGALATRPPLHALGRGALGAFLVLAGIQHFLFAPFVATLVPTWVPGALFWTYAAGIGLIAGGVGLAIPRTARLAATLTGAMIFTWLLMLHIPRALAMNDRNEWTAVVEALAMSGIAFALVAPPSGRDEVRDGGA